jgi:DNA-directed RNA polymerase subunit omega
VNPDLLFCIKRVQAAAIASTTLVKITLTGDNFMISKRLIIDSSEMMRRTDKLMKAASSRYKIVIQIARRAKRSRYETIDYFDDPFMKPVIRAILEMSDELTEPELLED